MSELVSVIIPTYNRAHLIGDAIESIIKQTYSNWELIIIDDGSNDNTEEVVTRYVAQDARIFYHKQRNAGSGGARNTGIRLAKGKYITFLDSDDVFKPEKIQKQYELIMQDTSIKVVVCEMMEMRNGQPNAIKKPVKQDDLYFSLLAGIPGAYSQTPLLFIEAKLLHEKDIYFDERFPTMDDVDFLISISKYSNYEVVNEILFESRLHGGNHINSENNIVAARLLLLEKYSTFYQQHPMVKKEWLDHTIRKYLNFKLEKNRAALLKVMPNGIRYDILRWFINHPPGSLFLRRVLCKVLL